MRAGLRAGFESGRNLDDLTGGDAKADVNPADGGSDDSDGCYCGAGYEVFLTDTVTAGAEILKHGFVNSDGTLSGTDAEATPAALPVKVRLWPAPPLRAALGCRGGPFPPWTARARALDRGR